MKLDGDELQVAGNPSAGTVLPWLGDHLARVEAVDRSRMPLQELISRLMRADLPSVGHSDARSHATSWPATATRGRP